jgi:hypothetical protein
LNAYYLPDGGDIQIDPYISPVNTYRMVFNSYFDQGFEMLDNVSYALKNYNDPTSVIEMPNTCPTD